MGIFGSKKDDKVVDKKDTTEKKKAPAKKDDSLKTQKSAPSQVKKSNSYSDYLIYHPHITEKAHDLSASGQYIFKVSKKDANKVEIKKIISKIYNVEVDKVRIINTPDKKRRLGRTVGKKPGYKKAIVILKKGQSIEIIPTKQ